jgi:hypothetical protein
MKCLQFLSVWLIVFTSSCATVSNISVNNVNDADALPSGSFVYALPQTVMDIHVVAEETTIIPGPYEKYAAKYLGIHGVPAKEEKLYSIIKIDLKKHLEADPDFLFTVNGVSDLNNFPGLINLIRDSLILTAANFSGNLVNLYSFPLASDEATYTDLSIKRNFEAEKDIEISRVMPDSNYVAQPSRRPPVLKEKTLEQKAEEAANFLIKLKKRRFKLIAGQYDYMPQGESMASALKELARIEEQYLSLFIGKRIVRELTRNYHYAPLAGKESDRVVLFRFAADKGFIDARESIGMPVILELNAMRKTRDLEKFNKPVRTDAGNLPYRIADQVNIRLLAGEQVWAEAIFPVFQYGGHAMMNFVH